MKPAVDWRRNVYQSVPPADVVPVGGWESQRDRENIAMNDYDTGDDVVDETMDDGDEALFPQCPNCGNEVHTSFAKDLTKYICEECGDIFRDEEF